MPQRPSSTQTALQGALRGQPRTEIDEELRQLLLPKDIDAVAHSPMTPPPVIGSPDLTSEVNDLFSLVPELKAVVSRIQNPPTAGVLNDIMRYTPRVQLEGYEQVGMKGARDPADRSIFIAPRTNAKDLPAVLAHELGHAAGHGEGRTMSNIEGLARMRQDAKEEQFQQWATAHGLNNPDDPKQFYDYRSAMRAGAEPNASGHWPSDFKKPGHPNEFVGGFNTRTGERVPGMPQASEQELIRLGWDADFARRVSRK